MSYTLLYRVLLLLLLFPVVALAQEEASEPVSVGLRGAYEYGDALMDWSNIPYYEMYYRGTVIGLSVAGELRYPSLLGKNWGMAARIARITSDARFSQSLPDALVLIPGNPLPVTQHIENHLSFSTEAYLLELLPEFHLGWLTANAGPYIGYRRIWNVRNTQELITPEGGQFTNPQGFPTENNGRTLVFDDGSALSQQSLALGLFGALSVSLELTEYFSLVPETFLRFDLLSPAGSGRWLGINGGGGIGIVWRLGSSSPGPGPDPAPPPLAFAAPTATLDLYSTSPGGIRQEQLSVLASAEKHQRQIQLPPILFFEKGATALPDRYHLLKRESAAAFSLDSISRLDARTAYYDLPNIIGAQLRQNRNARIRLTATTSPDAAPALARARAESLRAYLLDVWNLRREQIEIATDPAVSDAEHDAIRVESIAAPPPTTVEGEWLDYTFDTTPIRLKPSIKAPAGIRRWTITFRQNDSVIEVQTSDNSRDRQLNTNMLLRGVNNAATPKPLTAELMVEDSTGARTTASDAISFIMPDLSDTSYAREIASYEIFGPVSDALLRQIVAATPDNARITVMSVKGANGGSYTIAEDSVTAVAGRLHAQFAAAGRNGVEVAERHADERIHPAGDILPEERAMMGGVMIVIEQNYHTGLATKP
jgi:hypothetical protein